MRGNGNTNPCTRIYVYRYPHGVGTPGHCNLLFIPHSCHPNWLNPQDKIMQLTYSTVSPFTTVPNDITVYIIFLGFQNPLVLMTPEIIQQPLVLYFNRR